MWDMGVTVCMCMWREFWKEKQILLNFQGQLFEKKVRSFLCMYVLFFVLFLFYFWVISSQLSTKWLCLT